MTWKWAAVDLSHGGAKAGILGDPDASNKEEIDRHWCRRRQGRHRPPQAHHGSREFGDSCVTQYGGTLEPARSGTVRSAMVLRGQIPADEGCR
jgi:hypothetical protein